MNPMPPSGETRSSPRHFTPSTTTPTPTSTASGSSSSLSSSSSSSSSASPSSSSFEKSAVVCPDYLSGSCVNGSQCPLYHPPIMSPQHAFTAYQSSSSSPLTHHHHHHHHPLPLHNQNTSYPHNQMLADHLSMGFANMGFNNINLNHLLSHAQQHPSTTNSFLHHFHLQSSSFSQQDNQQLQQDLSSSSPPSSSPPASNVHDFSQPAGGSTSPVAASATSSSFDQLYSTSSASSSPLVSSSGVNTPSDALSHMVQQPSASSGNGSRSGSGSGASAFFPSRPGALHHHQHHPHQQQALHTDAYGNIYVTTMPSSTVFPLQSPLPSPHAHSSGVDGGMSHLHIDTQLSNHTTAAAGAFPYQFAPFYYPSISPTMAFHPHAHHQAATGVHPPPPPPLHASHHPQQLPHPLHRVSSHPLLAGPQLHHSHHSPLLHHNMSQSYSSRSLSSSSSSPSSSGSSSSSSSPSGGHPGHVYSSSRGDHQGQQARDVCRDYKHGVCSRGDRCRYLHIREVCADFLRGKCDRDKCKYSHDKSHGPQCVDFMRGVCHRGETCKFYHGRPPVCRDFQRSMCIRGDRCKYSHVTTTQNSITADSRYYPMNTAALTSAKNVEADTGMMTSNSVSESPLSETESFERKDTLENETEEARGSLREGSVILNHVSAASSSSSGEAVPMVVSASSSNSTSPYSSQATSPREASLSPSSGDATATTPSLAPMPPSVDVSSSQLPVLAPHPRMPISATRRSSLRSEDF